MPNQIIAIEEHFTSPHLRKVIAPRTGPIQALLDEMGGQRIKDMDEAGIDVAVLSENNPAAHNLDPEASVALAKASNDFLYEQIQANPKRFKGFAALPLPDPKAAADELERGVTKLGLLGAMIMGTSKGQFIDDKKFWPVFERAAKLDVPVYIHPSPVKPALVEAFFKEHGAGLQGSPLGFGLETLTHTFRLITSGLLDQYPTLRIVVGHLGETAPFTLWRTDHNLAKVMKLPKSFSDYYKTHFWLTTSGAFSNSALACAIAEMGIERIMFAVDWPYINNALGTKWLKAAPISYTDRALIFEGNAKKLLKI
ncbi:MAG: amidohydrolase [Xanthobacteraceae bacterium]|nr:amidohydrolase [Xanthobacteraceae bacterium]